jgi:TetR/AcrR family transcriptional regulator, cholesterol catabolism regulator
LAASRGIRSVRAGAKSVSFERIESEAIKLFSQKTYPAVGTRDIGDAVGILPGSLYAHIANKEELLFGIVRRGIQTYIDALAPISEMDRPAPERLRLIIRKFMEILHTTLDQTNVSYYQWIYLSPEKRRQVEKLRKDYTAIFASVISAAEFPWIAHPRVAVLTIIGMLNSAIGWYSPHGALTPTQLGEELADMALGGLCR